jgi:hypothetical protein
MQEVEPEERAAGIAREEPKPEVVIRVQDRSSAHLAQTPSDVGVLRGCFV